ncbi:MAG: hypothetical protein MUF61_00855 [archaeon]|nr:hypothetical protein [archaeon]
MKKRAKKPKVKRHAPKVKKMSKKEQCKLVCGCHSGRKWEECCGRCTLPC